LEPQFDLEVRIDRIGSSFGMIEPTACLDSKTTPYEQCLAILGSVVATLESEEDPIPMLSYSSSTDLEREVSPLSSTT